MQDELKYRTGAEDMGEPSFEDDEYTAEEYNEEEEPEEEEDDWKEGLK